MKSKIVITPQLMQDMEDSVRNSASFKAKIAEAKEHVSKNRKFVDKIFESMKSVKG